jgi:plasmid stabilization system protein ParE
MYQLVLKPEAVLMTKDAYDWYEAQRTGLGELFLTELDAFYKKIQTNPAANRKVKRNYRQGRLLRFPYVVVYEIMQTDIVVLSVFHTKRNPKHKFK